MTLNLAESLTIEGPDDSRPALSDIAVGTPLKLTIKDGVVTEIEAGGGEAEH